MDVYYLHFQYYHARVEWGTLCSGNHYLCECVYYFFMLLLAAFTEHQKNGGQREVFKIDTFCRIVGIVAFIVAGCIVLLV